MANSSKENWKAVKLIFRHLRGSFDVFLHFRRARDGVIRYVDSDFSIDLDK